ncbi:hypothetical protein D6T64_02945 [Cryobacterium melibiosiphilum]|uniref:Uncharacterized protein n=1 Tax=Cryobacterium melibiosiphilum TaxID=995039 RepID=A0A3A5MUE9_9MICO|nr:hypothetical protein [Cryobacterium melibiosiphilum]RJT90843.1 hypothetical protein D6T64_02945 [Cryobacterium melibiosiphilum]
MSTRAGASPRRLPRAALRARGLPRAGLIGVLLLAVFGGFASPAPTEAAFTDAEHGTSVALTAIVVPAPIIDTCLSQMLLLSLTLTPRVTITWHYPTAGYTGANARYFYYDTGLLRLVAVNLGSGVTTTGPSAGTYTSVFQGSLLAGLLAGEADVGLAAAHSSGWVSGVSMVHANYPLIAGTGTCTITNA